MKSLKGWDAYVADAQRDPVMISLPDGASVTVHLPTRRQTREFNKALAASDEDAMLKALLGEEQAATVLELLDEAPEGVAGALVVDVLKEFGLLPVDATPPGVGNSDDGAAETVAHPKRTSRSAKTEDSGEASAPAA